MFFGEEINDYKMWLYRYNWKFHAPPISLIRNNSYKYGFKAIVSYLHSRDLRI